MADDPFFYVILFSCLVVAGVLVWGVSQFGKGDSKKSNKIMQLRILAQFIAVVLIVGFAIVRSQAG